jgi:hypothetical protein
MEKTTEQSNITYLDLTNHLLLRMAVMFPEREGALQQRTVKCNEDYLKSKVLKNKKVWTLIENEDGSLSVVEGTHSFTKNILIEDDKT